MSVTVGEYQQLDLPCVVRPFARFWFQNYLFRFEKKIVWV